MKAPQESRIDRWGRSVTRGGALARVFETAYRSWFRVEWEGLENIPRTGGALLVSNHAGFMPVDGGLIQYGIEAARERPVYSLAHHGFWRVPFVGTSFSRSGAVVAHPDNAHRLLRDEGELVLVFPEGDKGPVKARSERYRLQRFGRGGFVETAMRAGVPVVPIALMGTEDTTPIVTNLKLRGQDFPITLNFLLFGPILGAVAHFPAKVRGRVLPPVHFDETPGQTRYSRSLLMDRAESIRTSLQQAMDEMHEARQSIWRG